MTEKRVGVLLPRSSLYPTLSIDLMSGFKAYLKKSEVSVKIFSENIGFGEAEAVVYTKVEKLLLDEDVSFVIAFIDHTEAFKLVPLFSKLNKLLVVMDPGGHIPIDWQSSPFCYTLSLQAAFGSRLTGQLSGQEGAVRPVFATSFYDGGYLQCFAYQKGIEAGGGQIQSHLVVPYVREDFSISPLHDVLEQKQPDSILAQFSIESGEFFLKEYTRSGLYKKLKLYTSPFMLEETWLNSMDYPFEGIKGHVTWFHDLENESNHLFKRTLGGQSNIFSMFGWETGQFFIQCTTILNKYNGVIVDATHELEAIAFESPRGVVEMHSTSHHLVAPMYITEVIPSQSGKCKLQLIDTVPDIIEKFEQYKIEKPEGVFSKWTNTYLCI
ncbi:ABC transporter substrate-binding protein [Solitalea lacus]|uniref:ABC transporter substrate-binding protein n=1 Tax=Solitalea lacus TaxID=2911172 RepID=UPI001EDA1570|nr:ABC transporter substrate-binding protein [Solitalea lacus]UKJ06771.1 ABC transporter substrate-binding protein [Solitalea lacus]